MSDDGWLNDGMPFIDHVFDGKTGREIVRENLKQWAGVPRINGFRVSWDEFLEKQKAINDAHNKVVELTPTEYSEVDKN